MSKELNFQLFNAIESGRLAKIKSLVENGADVNAVYKDSLPDKLSAHKRFSREVLSDLENTPLLHAIGNMKPKCAEHLLQKGASADATNKVGQTAMMIAVCTKQPDIIEMLIKAGSDVNWTHKNGNSPFHEAAWGRFVKGSQILFNAGADPCIKNMTPQVSAADVILNDKNYSNNKEVSLMQELMKLYVKNRHLSAGDRQRCAEVRDAEQRLLDYQLMKSIDSKDEEALDLTASLIRDGANVNSKRVFEYQANPVTPMHVAARANNIGALQVLIKNGAEPDMAALSLAISSDHICFAEKMLSIKGIDINGRTGAKRVTPLMVASEYGQLEMIKMLIERGADLEKRDSLGNTAFMRAFKSLESMKLLIECGAMISSTNKKGASLCDILKEIDPEDEKAVYLEACLEVEKLSKSITGGCDNHCGINF